VRRFRYELLAGLDQSYRIIKVFEGMGHLEKAIQYKLAQYVVTLPNGHLSRETFSCDEATADSVIGAYILGCSSMNAVPSDGSTTASSSASSGGV
jgi:hypothetical protein